MSFRLDMQTNLARRANSAKNQRLEWLAGRRVVPKNPNKGELVLIDKGIHDQQLQAYLTNLDREHSSTVSNTRSPEVHRPHQRRYTTIWLSYNRISDLGVKDICAVLLHNNHIKELYLDQVLYSCYLIRWVHSQTTWWHTNQNQITDEGARLVLEMLAVNFSLTKLKLDGNSIRFV